MIKKHLTPGLFKFTLMICALFLFSCDDTEDDTIVSNVWSGPKMTFTKSNNADWTLEENQDRITDNVWLTRKESGVLVNMVENNQQDTGNENGDEDGNGDDNYAYRDPSQTVETVNETADTEWALGTTADYKTLTFTTLKELMSEEFKNIDNGYNPDMVLHLITDDIYIDIKFTSWQSGNNGGGFSYDRSTKN